MKRQESNDLFCFQVSKFISLLVSQEVYREADGAVHHDQVIDQCKKNQFDNTECWSDASSVLGIGRLNNGYQFEQQGGGRKKRFQYCWSPNYPHRFLYFRAIQGHSGSIVNPVLQDNVQ